MKTEETNTTNGTDAVTNDLTQVVNANAPTTTTTTTTEKYDGQWVKSVRKGLKLTQQEFCAKVGVTQGLVSQVEKGSTPVSKKFKEKIEALLKSN